MSQEVERTIAGGKRPDQQAGRQRHIPTGRRGIGDRVPTDHRSSKSSAFGSVHDNAGHSWIIKRPMASEVFYRILVLFASSAALVWGFNCGFETVIR